MVLQQEAEQTDWAQEVMKLTRAADNAARQQGFP